MAVLRDLGSPQAAVRSTATGWRDPRLWVGVALVAGSVVVGSRVLAAADDTVQVWAVPADAVAGEQLSPDALVAARVRFADDDDLGRYLLVDDELPADLTLARPLGAGELLPRAALGEADDAGTVTVSLAVTPLLVPTGVGTGSVVDVYVTGDATPRRDAGVPALDDVTVVAVSASGDSFAPGGERQVELAVPDADVGELYALLGSMSAPTVSLVEVS